MTFLGLVSSRTMRQPVLRAGTILAAALSSDPVTDLTERGVLRRVPRSAVALPGEVGSGYKTSAAEQHIEPEEIFVLGTSHMSASSAADVEAAIAALRPDAIVIELCRSRSGLLYADNAAVVAATNDKAMNAFGLSGEGGPLRALQRSLALGGWAPLLLRVLLVRLSDTISGTAGVTPGADFRAAKRAADKLNATLVLGDRPIELTLERSWRALSWQERGRMLQAAWAALVLNDAQLVGSGDEGSGSSSGSSRGSFGSGIDGSSHAYSD